MAFIDDFSDLFTGTATHKALSSRDQYGAPTYGAGTAYSGRLVKRNKLVRDAAGQEKVSSAHFWLQGSPDVSPEDEVTLSDGSTPSILSVERFQDEDGASHTKLYFL